MSEPTPLAVERVRKSGDCRDWTVVDALEEALRQAREKPFKMVYVGFVEEENGKYFYPAITAGATTLEMQGLLAHHSVEYSRGGED